MRLLGLQVFFSAGHSKLNLKVLLRRTLQPFPADNEKPLACLKSLTFVHLLLSGRILNQTFACF